MILELTKNTTPSKMMVKKRPMSATGTSKTKKRIRVMEIESSDSSDSSDSLSDTLSDNNVIFLISYIARLKMCL